MAAEYRNSPLRVAIYARQSVKQEDGIEQQVEDCEGYVALRKWQLHTVYRDLAVSATKERGKGSQWHQMLEDFDAGLFDAIVCTRVDRLLRRVVDVVELRAPQRERDVQIVAFQSSIDTGEPTGGVLLTILVALAESEILIKNARSKRYAVERRAVGHPPAGRVPYGYEWVPKLNRDKNETRWKIVKSEAAIVRRISREFKAGKKLFQIAAGLNTNGNVTRAGSKWGTPTVRRILLSPFYAALLPPAQGWGEFDAAKVRLEECTPGAWPAILDRSDVETARHKLMDDKRRTNPEGTARKWLLSGLAVCWFCKAPVRAAKTREGFHGYRCPNGHFLRRGELLDSYVAEVIVRRLSEWNAVELLTPPTRGLDMGTLTALRDALNDREAHLSSRFAEGKLKPDALDQGLAIIAAERASVESQIGAAMATDPLASLVGASDVRAIWDGLPLGRQRAILEALFVPAIRAVGKGRRVLNHSDAEASMFIQWRTTNGIDSRPPWYPESQVLRHSDLTQESREKVAAAVSGN